MIRRLIVRLKVSCLERIVGLAAFAFVFATIGCSSVDTVRILSMRVEEVGKGRSG